MTSPGRRKGQDGFLAQWLNVHHTFPVLQRIAVSVTIDIARYPGI